MSFNISKIISKITITNSKIQMFKNYLNKWIRFKNKKNKFSLKRKCKIEKYKLKSKINKQKTIAKKLPINNSKNKILMFHKDLNK